MEKQKANKSPGYSIELFIDKNAANRYLCSICHHVVSDCHETSCGHIFCGGCIARILEPNNPNSGKQSNIGFKCPCCNQINSQRPHKSIYLNRAVKNLRVRCPFNQSGCKWKGALSDLTVQKNQANVMGHLMKCQYAPITCDECNNRICRADYDLHRKQCLKSCPNCSISFCSSNERKLHYMNCPIFVHCKLCNQRMKKSELQHHSKFLCPMRSIKCPFYHFGCHQVLKSKNLANHLKFNAAQHYQLKVDHCINKMEKMKLQIEASSLKQNALQQQNESLSKQLAQIKQKIKKQQVHSLVNNDSSKLSVSAPDILLLCGSNQWEESGVFIRRSKLHEDRVCYTSLRTKCAIRWNSELCAWCIDRRGLSSDNEASLIAYDDVFHPGLVTSNWSVYHGDIEEWQQSKNYKIKSYNLAEFILKTEQIFASHSNDNDNDDDESADVNVKGLPPGFTLDQSNECAEY